MEKKRISKFLQRLSVGRKMLLTMRLSMVLTILFSFNVYAKAVSQTVSLNLQNVTLREAFEAVKQQTGVYFVYNEEEVSQDVKLNVEVSGVSLENAMRQILEGLPYSFECLEGMVVITPVPEQQAQKPNVKVLKGKVTDANGDPIPGATVIVQGLPQGCATNNQGEYVLVIENKEGVTLLFSFVGMETVTRVWKGEERLDVVLHEASLDIDEVVVTGYQVLDRRESASAVSVVKADDIMIAGAPTIDQMLQGQIPGMMVMTTSGEPSATPKIRIRGNATINGNKAPVWVVDGVILEQSVPFTASDLNSEDAEYLIGNAISGISPQDIESITVLKDASATAIYGVKAANGVIVITTKKGQIGKPRITYNADVVFNQRPAYRNMDRMNSAERMQLSKEIVEAGLDYPRIPDGDSYEGLLEQLYAKEITTSEFQNQVMVLQKRNTDWFKEIFRNTVTHTHTLTVSGGSQDARYYFSASYNKNPGTSRGSSSERLTTTAKVDVVVNKALDFSVKTTYSTTTNKGFHSSVDPFNYAYQRSRTLPAYNEDGSYHLYDRGNGLYYNFLKEQANTGDEGKINDFTALLSLNLKLVDGLSYGGVFSFQKGTTSQRTWATEESYYVSNIRGYEYHEFDETSEEYQDSPLPYGGILEQSYTDRTNYTIRNTLTYMKVFKGVHDVNVMGGLEIRGNKYMGVSTTGYGWNPDFGEKFMPVYTDAFIADYVRGERLNPNNTNTNTRVASFFGTASYSYDNRYVLNANIRSDGANKFGTNPKYRWLPTWSVAGKWIVSNENFMKGASHWLDHLSIRGSYGIQGNIHEDATPYLIVQYEDRDATSSLEYYSIDRLPNPDLRWEKTKSWNVAADFTLFKGRLKGSLDVYRKNTSDLIMSKAVSTSNGRSYLYMNAGKMRNYGVEGFLNVEIIRKKMFDWRVGFNFGRNVNETILANGESYTTLEDVELMLDGELAVEGAPIGSMYSFRFAGLSHENGYPLFYGTDGKLYHEGEPQLLELVNSGSIFPKLSGGFDTQLTFNKRLSLSLGFTYNLGGVKRLPDVYEDNNAAFDPLTNVSTKLQDRWRQPGDEEHTTIPVLWDDDYADNFYRMGLSATRPGVLSSWAGTRLYNYSDERVVTSNFLRLRTLALSYRVPEKFLSTWGASSMMLRFQATNLFVIASKKWGGLDPETPTSKIPVVPTYSLTLNVSF